MSKPPSPQPALTSEIHRWAAVLAGIARRVADGAMLEAASKLQGAAVRLQELSDELLALEVWEYEEQLALRADGPPADPAKDPDWRLHLGAHPPAAAPPQGALPLTSSDGQTLPLS